MDWQATLARSLGKPLDARTHPRRSNDNIDKMTEMGRPSELCHYVISVTKNIGAASAEPSPPIPVGAPVSLLSQAEVGQAEAPPTAHRTAGRLSWQCYNCGGQRYFLNSAGQPICSRCHPPVDPIRFPIN